jgi:putative serine protease PepD
VSIQVANRTSAGEGSGSIISSDGYVLTNHHVVSGGGNNAFIQVTLNDGRTLTADYVASDAATDIAVVKIRDASDLPVVQFGDSDELSVGQEVVAIGSPLGLSSTVTYGIVSALNRPVRASDGGGESSLIDAIQTDAAINPGNSGGPLVDMDGNIIGMNSVIASLSSGGEAGSIGLGFAIPANFAKRVADQLISTGGAAHPMLGVQVAARQDVKGALIASVEPDSPAQQAGLTPGDVVTRVDNRAIDNSDALVAAIRSQNFGQTVTLEVQQQDTGQSRQVEVTLTAE